MARQHLVHLHTSGTALPSAVETEGLRLGEIAVQHNVNQPELIIATVTGETPTFAHFIDSSAVDAKIAAATSTITTDVTALKAVTSGYTGEGAIKTDVNTAKNAVTTEATARAEADEALSARLGEGVTGSNTATQQFDALRSAITTANTAIEGLESRVGAVETNVSTLQSVTSGYSGAGAIKSAVDAVSNAVAAETSARADADTAINNKIGGSFDATNTVAKAIDTVDQKVDAEVSARTALDARVGEAEDDITTLQEVVSGLSSGTLTEVLPGTPDDYVSLTISPKDGGTTQTITVASDIQSVAAASASNKGLAEASDVKTYVDGKADALAARLGEGVTSDNTATQQFKSVTDDVTELKGTVSGYSSTSTIKAAIDAVSAKSDTALQSISKGSDGSYVTTTVGTKDANNNQAVSVAVTTKDVSAATSGDNGLAVAYDVQSYVSAQTSGVISDMSTVKNQLSGIDTTQGAVKNYIDTKTSSVFVYKGTCTYEQLPASGNVKGDVWNVSNAHGAVPAGTNYAWDGAAWDPLAGTIDTSVFMTNDAFTTWTSTTYTQKQNAQDTSISNLETSASTLFANVLYGIVTGTSGDYVTVTIGKRDSANRTQSVGVSVKSSTLAAATANTDGLAIAYDVKQAINTVDAKLGSGFDSTNTVQKAIASANSDITSINQKLGSGFTSVSTVADQLAAVKTTADGAVQDVVFSGISGVTKNETSGVITFDFTGAIIDCGTY